MILPAEQFDFGAPAQLLRGAVVEHKLPYPRGCQLCMSSSTSFWKPSRRGQARLDGRTSSSDLRACNGAFHNAFDSEVHHPAAPTSATPDSSPAAYR